MADIELVIKIPEDVFKRTVFYREFRDLNDCVTTIKALENGTPLPKGHGRLIDADSLWNAYHDLDCDFYEAFDLADTIIEADAESEDKE